MDFYWTFITPVDKKLIPVILLLLSKKSDFENEIFVVTTNFFTNWDFKNECKNEFKDNNEKP